MKKSINQLLVLALNTTVAGLLLSAAQGAAFIKFDGIDGESTDKDHRGWSELESFSQAIHKPGGSATGATRRRGDVIMKDLTYSKELDKSSPKIAEAIAKGKVFLKVEIHLTRDAGGERVTYYRYELKNVLVTSYSVGGSSSDSVPVEQISLNFEEIKVTYTEVGADGAKKGNVEYSWKIEEGEVALIEEADPTKPTVGDDTSIVHLIETPVRKS